MLKDLDPPRLVAGGLAIRAEKDGADLVIAHRDLGGLALTTGLGAEQATVFWGQFSTLNRSDDFDDARGRFEVARFSVHGEDGWADPLLACLATELQRSIRVELECDGQDRVMRARAYLTEGGDPVWTSQRFWRRFLKGPARSKSFATSFMATQRFDLERCGRN